MNIALFGPPGAGKGTQARLLEDAHQFTTISTGEMLREEINNRSPLGLEVKETIEAGGFISDDLMLAIFEHRLVQEKDQSLILDGIPRTVNQAERVDEIFERLGFVLDAVIQIAVDDEELIKRLSSRFICKTCNTSYTPELPPRVEGVCDKCEGTEFIRRPDDEPGAIKTRLDVYNEQTKPVMQYYSQTNRLHVVDGMRSVEEVNGQIEDVLRQISNQ